MPETDRTLHDDFMPDGWHTIKSVVLNEMRTAGNFHLCCRCADALFHARLIGEGVAREVKRFRTANPDTRAEREEAIEAGEDAP